MAGNRAVGYVATLLAATFLVAGSGAYAQHQPDADTDPSGGFRNPAGAFYDIVALRVEFQPDSSRFSTGDGTFGANLFQGLEPRIDPLPHDEAYFKAHLGFLKGYIEQVSKRATVVTTHLIPEVVRVSGTMAEYSPTGLEASGPDETAKLARLVQEAWALADKESAFNPNAVGIDPAATAFVLFHAGTGRDVELTGTILDRTPEDLPSIYFDGSSLDRLLGGPISFKGLDVNNTAIIPETESKRAVDPFSEEPFLLELSINGLLAASFLNYLGVPDLFDTATGTSAIGPFGLMDPFGIFAYSGLLPPEPSGWTKYYLGWNNLIRLSGPDETQVQLRAGVDAAIVPISSTEFFLVEVRHRDPAGDGLNLRVLLDGQIVDVHFDHDATDFNAFDQSGFSGVLVGSDDFDWVLPGGFDSLEELRLGGILIWHVDDQRFVDRFATNSVNADPRNRALDVEEADSAPDLGFPSSDPFAPGFDRGTPFDFYFKGNPVVSITESGEVQLYENRFSSTTWPNSETNGGGTSFVILEDFSEVGPTMTLTYRRDLDASFQPVDELTSVRLDGTLSELASVTPIISFSGSTQVPSLFVQSGGTDPKGWIIPVTPSPSVTPIPGVLSKPVTLSGGDEATIAVAFLSMDDDGAVFFTRKSLLPGPPDVRYPLPEQFQGLIPSTSMVAIQSENAYFVGYDLGSIGAVLRIGSNGEIVATETAEPVSSLAALPDGSLAVVMSSRTDILQAGITEQTWTYSSRPGGFGPAVFGSDNLGLIGAIPVNGSGTLLLLTHDGRVLEVKTLNGAPPVLPAVTDVDADGYVDIVYGAGPSLEIVGREGGLLSGYPLAVPAPVQSQPIIYQRLPDDFKSVLLSLENGYLYEYMLTENPELKLGFPLAVGGTGVVTPAIINDRVYTVSSSGTVHGWSLGTSIDATWGQLFADAGNTSFLAVEEDSTASPAAPDGFLVQDETYNWPNPIRDGVTRFRIVSLEPCTVDITVIDMAGGLVHRDIVRVETAGVPAEFVWQTDVPSGVYFANLRATGDSGATDSKLVRIAVIR